MRAFKLFDSPARQDLDEINSVGSRSVKSEDDSPQRKKLIRSPKKRPVLNEDKHREKINNML